MRGYSSIRSTRAIFYRRLLSTHSYRFSARRFNYVRPLFAVACVGIGGSGVLFASSFDVVDDLFEQQEYQQAYDLLLTESNESADVLWRLARLCRFLSKDEEKDAKEREAIARQGLEYALAAVAKDESNWAAQKWAGISYNNVSDYLGSKEALQNAFVIKDHFERSFEIHQDPTTAHLIGLWCSYFANMSWITRNAAALLFSTPPSSTMDEALKWYLEAENLSPDFYAVNTWEIAKTYKSLKKNIDYQRWRKKTLAHERSGRKLDIDEQKAIEEAKQAK